MSADLLINYEFQLNATISQIKNVLALSNNRSKHAEKLDKQSTQQCFSNLDATLR